ncbi:g3933 [Coccomyxa elongata]
MQVAEQQQVPACRSRPGEHSPGEASATAFPADTPDELDLDGDDSLPCAQQAQRIQQSPLKAMPDRNVTQPTTGKSKKAPLCDIAGKTTGSVPYGPHSVSKGGGVSTQPAAQAPSGCLPAAQEWKSNVGEAFAQPAAQPTSPGLIAPQDIKMHECGFVAERATTKPDAEQGNERRGLVRELCEPNAKKPRTLQPDVESRHAAQKCDEASLGREPLEPIAKEPCRAEPDVESKDAALCQVGELATSTNADQINSSPCDVFASFTSFQDLSDDEGHLNNSQAGVNFSLEQLASVRSPKRART